MKIFSIISVVILFTMNSFAQIVLGPEKLISAGDKIITQSMDTTGVTEGGFGANQTWDFSGLAASDALVIEYVDASATPYHSSFPNAPLASVISEGEIASYSYFSIEDNKIISHGTGSDGFVKIYGNTEIIASYPFSYNSTFADDFEGVTDMGDDFISKNIGEINFVGDAYGMITLPDGSVENALRVKTVQKNVDSLFIGEFFFMESYVSTTTYNWYIASAKYPVFSISYIITEILGETMEFKNVSYTPNTPTAIEDDNNAVQLNGYTFGTKFS
jgi:hypothetical protein